MSKTVSKTASSSLSQFWLLMLLLIFLVIGSVYSSDLCAQNEQGVIVLSNGINMPRVGFGIAGMKGETTKQSVRNHVENGFRLIDGAEATEWYDDVAAGEAIQSLDRNRLFLVSKVHPRHLTYDDTIKAVNQMLLNWNRTDYMDLVLLHFPACGHWIPHCRGKTGGDWKQAYRALEDLYKAGKIRAIGVSNFDLDQLNQLYLQTRTIHVIQHWMDPFYQNLNALEWAFQRNIAVTAYSSFGEQWQGRIGNNPLFTHPVLQGIARAHKCSITDVVLDWLLHHKKVAVIPRTTKLEHVKENAKFLNPNFFLVLSDAEVKKIDELNGMADES